MRGSAGVITGANVKLRQEQVPRLADASYGIFHFRGRAFRAPYHAHPEAEITHLIAGRGEFVVGDGWGRFAGGEVIVQGPGLPHSYRSRPEGRAESRYLQWREDSLGEAFWRLPESAKVRAGLARAARGLRLSPPVAAEVAARLAALAPTRGLPRLTGLLELWALIADDARAEPLASEGYAAPRPAGGERAVERVLRALDAGWRDELRLEAVAAELGMHPRSLSRFCRRRFRRGFRELLIERRLAEVARRLLEGEGGVAETAFACGFNNLSNFNALFRRAYGCAPREFRARTQAD